MSIKGTILVVDDSTSNLLGMQKILEKEGFNVHTTTNGEEAIKIMEEKPIDVVLLDLMMPGFSGFDVLGETTKIQEIKDIPIIIVSARSNAKDVKDALERGAVDYIKKPIDITELLARTGAAIKLKSRQYCTTRLNNIADYSKEMNLAKLTALVKSKLRDDLGGLNDNKEEFCTFVSENLD